MQDAGATRAARRTDSFVLDSNLKNKGTLSTIGFHDVVWGLAKLFNFVLESVLGSTDGAAGRLLALIDSTR